MEDDLKILKVEYLSNHWSDLPQILNLGWGDQTKIEISWNEDDLQWKTSKVEYFSNHLSDHATILNLSRDDQTIFYKFLKWRRPPMEDDLKILKVEYLSNPWLDLTKIYT